MKQKFLSLYDWCIENNYSILLNEWDYDLNEITPKDVSWGTHKKVYWVCSKCGNIYLSSIVKRTIGRNCPICAGKKVILGYNDFATLCPNLLKEWDFSKNVISPYEITKGSNKKVWWVCPKGHSYEAVVNIRTRENKPSSCPFCSTNTSIPEISLFLILSKLFKNVEHRKKINNIEYDICINDLRLLIEYDGEYWHKNRRDIENRKEKTANAFDYDFIRIYEVRDIDLDILKIDKNICYIDGKIAKNITSLIKYFLKYLALRNHLNIDINNLDLNNIEIEAREYKDFGILKNSLKTLRPDIAKEWHPIKNGTLKPDSFAVQSNYKAWWICKKGHEWKTSIAHRTRDNTKCPYCTNEKILKGFNDLETWCNKKDRMDILKRWDYDKNIVKIFEIAHTTNKKYWFRCPNGCSYSRAVSKEIIAQSCPICHKKFIDSEKR